MERHQLLSHGVCLILMSFEMGVICRFGANFRLSFDQIALETLVGAGIDFYVAMSWRSSINHLSIFPSGSIERCR